jgi:hypothetical protein
LLDSRRSQQATFERGRADFSLLLVTGDLDDNATLTFEVGTGGICVDGPPKPATISKVAARRPNVHLQYAFMGNTHFNCPIVRRTRIIHFQFRGRHPFYTLEQVMEIACQYNVIHSTRVVASRKLHLFFLLGEV